jgi:hypothetical protein
MFFQDTYYPRFTCKKGKWPSQIANGIEDFFLQKKNGVEDFFLTKKKNGVENFLKTLIHVLLLRILMVCIFL